MKKNIAVVCGGYSKERFISLKTADNILNNLDDKIFEKYKVVLDTDGNFFCEVEGESLRVNKKDFKIDKANPNISFDIAVIAIHGIPGESGELQEYFDSIGMLYTTVSSEKMSKTFDKHKSKTFIKNLNLIKIPEYLFFSKSSDIDFDNVIEKLGLPCFVKPNKEGSSLGVSKVSKREDMSLAVEKAFGFDDGILIESFVSGKELSVGVITYKGNIVALPITEIIPQHDFFDYESKYSGKSLEITPAKISRTLEDMVKEVGIKIYKEFEIKGLCRIDLILDEKNNEAYFLEINTIPGMTKNSIIPQQMSEMGINFKELMTDLINQFLKK